MPEFGGLSFVPLTERDVVTRVRDAMDSGTGGWIVTPNVDIVRHVRRSAELRRLLTEADLVVADGAPVVWASKVKGTPLPARVAGSDLIWSLSAGVAADNRSIYVLGGEPEAIGRREGARRAAEALLAANPGLRIAGYASPRYGFDSRPAELAAVCQELVDSRPDLVFVGLGFPRQEQLINRLRPQLPSTWFLGCGAAINFVAGDVARAPGWMQRNGLEWAHRLGTEPRRLAGRYLRHDAPEALRLLAGAARRRARARVLARTR
jgi:N-acetylglucosaminyldiphosphoundecaprenol N-acetyl-beta-D-mannosaminyltransferase